MRRCLILIACLGFVLLIGLLGCGSDTSWPDRPGPKVVVSFAPVYCFTANVAGDDAVVKNMMTTTGPHDFNPTDIEARLLGRANLLFVNGLSLDDGMADTLKRGSGNRGLKVVALGGRIPADRLLEGECHHDHAAGEKHDHGTDPHVWLHPELAALMVDGIRDELTAADPTHAAGYEARAKEYKGRLDKLHKDGEAKLKGKADRKLVTFHESLSYFAKAFNLTVEGVVQKKPGVEPNSDELSALIKLCKEKGVRLIAVEPQYSGGTSAKAVLEELKRQGIADARLVEIDPLETVTPGALTPDWYERRMNANIDALAEAMK